jgi:hypothetical protein
LGVGACGKIPADFRGKYVDSAHGVEVALDGKGGTLALEGESPRRFQARATEVAALAKGQAGIYLRSLGETHRQDAGDLEVFWVEPDPSSMQEQYGFVTLKARVLYTRFKLGRRLSMTGLAESITARFCEQGQILVDRVSQTFNGGCPGDSVLLNLKRVPAGR